MTTINMVGNGLNGQTGTGNFVGSNSPTLVTPNIGTASATSLTFGAGVLSTYSVGTFTPIFSLLTPGDLSVVYATQQGFYTKIGRLVFGNLQLVFTPTYTTASGAAYIDGLPFNCGGGSSVGTHSGLLIVNSSVVYTAPRTLAFSAVDALTATTVGLGVYGSATATQFLSATDFPSTVQRAFQMSFRYTASS